jgi:hypothetical protein
MIQVVNEIFRTIVNRIIYLIKIRYYLPTYVIFQDICLFIHVV